MPMGSIGWWGNSARLARLSHSGADPPRPTSPCPAAFRTSVEDDDHLAAGLVGLHDSMRLADLFEAEDPQRLHVETSGRGVSRDLLQGHVREWESWGAEHEAAEEA